MDLKRDGDSLSQWARERKESPDMTAQDSAEYPRTFLELRLVV
jgi:hypothetical protein